MNSQHVGASRALTVGQFLGKHRKPTHGRKQSPEVLLEEITNQTVRKSTTEIGMFPNEIPQS